MATTRRKHAPGRTIPVFRKTSNGSRRLDASVYLFCFEFHDHGEYNDLFFSQVIGQFLGEFSQSCSDQRQFRISASMYLGHFHSQAR